MVNINKVLKAIQNAFWCPWSYIKGNVDSLRCWWNHNANKYHFNLILTAFKSYPFDYTYMWELEKVKLEEMRYYFSNAKWIEKSEYDRYCKDISITIRMLEIMLADGWEDYYKKPEVNVKNWNRFLPHYRDENINKDTKEEKEAWRQYMLATFPQVLYMAKAKHIYYKMLKEHSEEWWD